MKVIFYHKNCNDGLFSAYNLWRIFGSKDALYIDVNYKPIQDMEPLEALEYLFKSYIDNPKTITGVKYSFNDNLVTLEDYKNMEVYVVDYSFPVEHFVKHTELFKSVLVLDHHDTAVKSYTKYFKDFNTDEKGWKTIKPTLNSQIVFSEFESGAKLTYMFFNEDREVPKFIELISDRDLWTFNLKNSRTFNYGCKLFTLDNFNVIDNLVKTDMNLHSIIFVGEKYENYHNERLAKIAKGNTSEITVILDNNEYRCAMINSYPDIASDLCDYVIANENYPMAICYNIDKRGNVGVSLRSREGLDSSKLSLMYGGGGHKRASGFQLTLVEFYMIMQNQFIEVTYTGEEQND